MEQSQSPSPSNGTANGLQRLKSEHLKMIELCLAGWTRSQIAESMDYSPEGVGRIMLTPIFQEELGRRRSQLEKKMDKVHTGTIEEAKKLIADNAKRAVEVHVEIMDSAQASCADRQRSADSILKQIFAGEGASGKGSGVANVVVLEPGAIQLLQVALQESE